MIVFCSTIYYFCDMENDVIILKYFSFGDYIMRKFTSNLGIRTYILLITSIFTIIIGLIITAGSYFMYSRYMENSITEAAETNMKFLAAYIDNEIGNIDQLITYCRNSSTIDSFISSKNSNKKRNDAYELLNEFSANSPSKYLHRVVITNLSGSYIQIVSSTNSSTINIAETLEEQDFYSELSESGFKEYVIGFTNDPFYPRKTNMVVPILQPISYKFNSDLGGYIFIEVDQKLFVDAFKKSYQKDNGELLLTLGDHTYYYSNNSFLELNEPLPENQYHVISQPLSKADCYVSIAIPLRQAKASQIVFTTMLVVIFLSLILLASILNVVLDIIISTPVNKIRHKLSNISNGDFTRDTSIEWNHELGDIGRGVNDLAESVSLLIDTRIANEKQKKDLEYKMLQSQINPHFIYNTLNSIKWMATVQGATGISDMTTALARLLKSISKGTKLLIPLSEELKLIEDYFTIQKYRYGGTIEMNINVEDDSLLDCQIIKFTLQPLVENAIFHGIEPTGRAGIIDINVTEQDNNLTISITDNGVGMTEEQARKILSDSSDTPSDFFKEIGVSNVHKRLQYQFGESYGINIDSIKDQYTTMNIIIPKNYQ